MLSRSNRAIVLVMLVAIPILLAAACDRESTSPAPPAGDRATPAPGGASSAGRTQPKSYRCDDLITAEEIEQILGKPGTRFGSETRGEEHDAPGFTSCAFAGPGELLMQISVHSGSDQLEIFDVGWQQGVSENAQGISGVGESALLRANVAGATQLLVRAKGCGVTVGAMNMTSIGGVDEKETLKRIAARIVERL